MLGNNTLKLNPSAIEISLVSNQCFWLLAENEESFLSYADFPWFKEATIAPITNVECLNADHLYWPILDIDLSVESARDPSKFPLISKAQSH